MDGQDGRQGCECHMEREKGRGKDMCGKVSVKEGRKGEGEGRGEVRDVVGVDR